MDKKKLIILVLFLSFSFLFVQIASINKKNLWPIYKANYGTIVKNAQVGYKKRNINTVLRFVNYSPYGSYMNYESKSFVESSRLKFDEHGIPTIKYSNSFFYNPVTIAQYALSYYGKSLVDVLRYRLKFLQITDFLLDLKGKDGAFRYPFEWKYYLTNEIYQPGWISGMAQGQALSVFSRAFHITGDERYINAAKSVFRFLITPKEKGGPMVSLADLDPSLDNYVFFEEYRSTPNNYTLNGYMFTLIGIYDYIKALEDNYMSSSVARYYFNKGVESLLHLLPYYDLNGFTSYDLGHYTFDKPPHIGVGYHSVHIYLLHALYKTVPEHIASNLKYFEVKWHDYTR